MTPKFVRAVDPIFQSALNFLERLEQPKRLVLSDERARIQKKFDQAEAMLGNSEDWQLAKYALVCWLDAKLVQTPWEGKTWWMNNPLEKHYYMSGDGYEKFFKNAQQAATLSNKDALEVFYICVVLGFRGFYHDSTSAARAEHFNLPPTIESWARQVAMSIQLRQGRPPIDQSTRLGGTANPLLGRSNLITMSLISTSLLAAAVGYFYFFFYPTHFGS